MQTIHFAPGCVEHWHRRMLWEGHYVATNPKDHTGHADLIETHITFFDFGSALKKNGSPMVRLAIWIGLFRN